MVKAKDQLDDMRGHSSTAPPNASVPRDGIYREFGKVYDDLYLGFADYPKDSEFIQEVINHHWRRQRRPQKLLDVGCGTGSHAIEFVKRFNYKVTGIDESDTMLRQARRKAARIDKRARPTFAKRDMVSGFKVGGKFDVAICMLNSFGYALEDAAVDRLLLSVRSHLVGDGLFIIEFWQHGSLTPTTLYSSVPERTGFFSRNVRRVMKVTPLNGHIEASFSFEVFGVGFVFDFGLTRLFLPKSFREVHRLNVHSIEGVNQLAERTGYDILGHFDRGSLDELSRSFDSPTEETVRVLSVLKKRAASRS